MLFVFCQCWNLIIHVISTKLFYISYSSICGLVKTALVFPKVLPSTGRRVSIEIVLNNAIHWIPHSRWYVTYSFVYGSNFIKLYPLGQLHCGNNIFNFGLKQLRLPWNLQHHLRLCWRWCRILFFGPFRLVCTNWSVFCIVY
jgi:hypothetical protein